MRSIVIQSRVLSLGNILQPMKDLTRSLLPMIDLQDQEVSITAHQAEVSARTGRGVTGAECWDILRGIAPSGRLSLLGTLAAEKPEELTIPQLEQMIALNSEKAKLGDSVAKDCTITGGLNISAGGAAAGAVGASFKSRN